MANRDNVVGGQTVVSKRDSDWVRRRLDATAKGDRLAFKQLYDVFGGALLTLAKNIVHDLAGAEDVLQEAFIEIWRNAASFDAAKGGGYAWMAGIVRFRALDRIRRESTQRRYVADAKFEPRIDFQRDLSGVDSDLAKLLHCMKPLGAAQRRGILLAYYYGYSHRQIADRLETPIGTVKAWIRRGLASVRECMGA